MINLGLTASERRSYERALAVTRPFYTTAYILDRNENVIRSLTSPRSLLLDGEVAVDAKADITRSCQLDILDPTHRLHLSPTSPRKTALFPGMGIRVIRHDYVAALGEYVHCPVFWGPLTHFQREGHVVRVEAVGKEALNLEPRVMWEGFTIPKGKYVMDAIEYVLRKAGEQRFGLPDRGTRKLPKQLAVGRHDEGIRVAKRLCRSLNRQGFYDGRGKWRVRKLPTTPVFTFYDLKRAGKPNPTTLSEPRLTYDFTQTRNLIEVLGQEPQGNQRRPRWVSTPRASNALSAQSLAFNGEPAYMVETIEDDKVRRKAQAKTIARARLKSTLRIGVQVEFDCLPIPHLEENDLVRLVLEDTSVTFRMQQFTIPLTADSDMSVGSLKRSKVGRRR